MSDESNKSSLPAVVGSVLVIYFMPFVFVFLDEVVFETRWVDRIFPPWFREVFSVVYAPFIWLVRQFL